MLNHLAFSKDRKLRFPLLSDFEPKGEVARKYGVYRREDGISERALFVIDKFEWCKYSSQYAITSSRNTFCCDPLSSHGSTYTTNIARS
jgi:peroxiredoxin